MNTSLAQDIYSITSSDTITLTSTASSSSGTSYYYNTGGSSGTVTLTSSTGSGYAGGVIAQDLTAIDPNIFTWKTPEEFVDAFPDFDRIQKMCKTYPGLKIAYEKFVTTYKLVKDDYDNPNIEK